MPSAWKCHYDNSREKTLQWSKGWVIVRRDMRPSRISRRLSTPQLGHWPPSGCFLHFNVNLRKRIQKWCSLHSLCVLLRALYPGFYIMPSPEDLLVRNELQSSPPIGWEMHRNAPLSTNNETTTKTIILSESFSAPVCSSYWPSISAEAFSKSV